MNAAPLHGAYLQSVSQSGQLASRVSSCGAASGRDPSVRAALGGREGREGEGKGREGGTLTWDRGGVRGPGGRTVARHRQRGRGLAHGTGLSQVKRLPLTHRASTPPSSGFLLSFSRQGHAEHYRHLSRRLGLCTASRCHPHFFLSVFVLFCSSQGPV